MRSALDDHALADLLPGSWVVAATNLPRWMDGQRRNPRFAYAIASTEPLVLSEDVEYTDAEGQSRHILGRSFWGGDGFVGHGRGVRRLISSRWSVEGASDDGTVLAIRFAKSMATPAGVDIIVRDGAQHPELRAMIARDTERFGLSPEDFASLSWLAGATR